jgi:hypothetical protein
MNIQKHQAQLNQNRSCGSSIPPLVKADPLPPLLLPDGRQPAHAVWLGGRPEPGHGRPAVQPLLLLARRRRREGRVHVRVGDCGRRRWRRGRRGRVLCAVGPARVGRRAGCVGRLVDVLAVDVDGVGDEGRAAMAAAGVALLEPEELDLGLDAFDEAHGDGSVVVLRGWSGSVRARGGETERDRDAVIGSRAYVLAEKLETSRTEDGACWLGIAMYRLLILHR